MSVTTSVRVKLAILSGNRCAMPDCNQRMLESRGDGHVLVGEVAHIAGLHGGGPRPSARFDPKMSEEERNSLSNLLFVCANCHKRIDVYPEGERDFPRERLLRIKEDHESKFQADFEACSANVTFRELEAATAWIRQVSPPAQEYDFTRIPLDSKIRKNGLSPSSASIIRLQLAAVPQVRTFIQALSQDEPNFPDRLKSGFLAHYFALRSKGILNGEDLFNSMRLFARRGFVDITTQAAAEAVLIYLFETCEVFEK